MLQKRVVYREVINQKTYAFYPNEKAIIDNLSNIPDIDVSAFPSAEEVQHFYMQDPALYLFAKEIAAVYEVKRDMYGKLLEGKSFNTARNELIAMTLTFPDTIVENYLTGKQMMAGIAAAERRH